MRLDPRQTLVVDGWQTDHYILLKLTQLVDTFFGGIKWAPRLGKVPWRDRPLHQVAAGLCGSASAATACRQGQDQ
jgi:hypothetical protein